MDGNWSFELNYIDLLWEILSRYAGVSSDSDP
jgi:hypothetical protein